eukprot:GHVS01064520.1.p1 GENE.GHVS01064520.1~~GHVS01064520.1.p1  ORF type:complete len:441 (-),score=66.41 GHVS01064520.1:227-1429(-)
MSCGPTRALRHMLVVIPPTATLLVPQCSRIVDSLHRNNHITPTSVTSPVTTNNPKAHHTHFFYQRWLSTPMDRNSVMSSAIRLTHNRLFTAAASVPIKSPAAAVAADKSTIKPKTSFTQSAETAKKDSKKAARNSLITKQTKTATAKTPRKSLMKYRKAAGQSTEIQKLAFARRTLKTLQSKGKETSTQLSNDKVVMEWYDKQIAIRKQKEILRAKSCAAAAEKRHNDAVTQLAKRAEKAKARKSKNLPNCNLRTAKKIANRLRKKGLLTTTGWSDDKYISWYRARLLSVIEKKEFNSDKSQAKQLLIRRQNAGKPVPPSDVSVEVLVAWYRSERNKRLLTLARKAAADVKNKAGINPATTQPELLLFWYDRFRMQLASKKRGTSPSVVNVKKVESSSST